MGQREDKAEGRLGLTAGRAELELSLAGGCITAFRWRHEGSWIDWLRPAPSDEGFAPTEAACFPLVPYSNRIRDGRFDFDGETYQLARNFPPEPHSIHGHGWQRRWRVEDQDVTGATLAFEFPAADGDDPWPAAYRAEQRFQLTEESLAVELSVANLGPKSMPVSLGLHPYFFRTPACHLIAGTGRMWESDAGMMPIRLVDPPAGKDPTQGIQPAKTNLDTCFAGFAGKAEIDWPEWGARLTITSDDSLGFLVIFTPPGADFFCVEPVSAMTDAVNRAEQGEKDSGLRIIAPGERFTAATVFSPQLA